MLRVESSLQKGGGGLPAERRHRCKCGGRVRCKCHKLVCFVRTSTAVSCNAFLRFTPFAMELAVGCAVAPNEVMPVYSKWWTTV